MQGVLLPGRFAGGIVNSNSRDCLLVFGCTEVPNVDLWDSRETIVGHVD